MTKSKGFMNLSNYTFVSFGEVILTYSERCKCVAERRKHYNRVTNNSSFSANLVLERGFLLEDNIYGHRFAVKIPILIAIHYMLAACGFWYVDSKIWLIMCVFASCTSVYVLRVYVWLHVCSHGRWCVFGYESCPCVRMLVKCASVVAEGCAYVINGN